MRTLLSLIKRNFKLYFKDKGMFFVSLITPAILLVLYTTFLGNVFRQSFKSSLPPGVDIENSLIEGLVGGQLLSSVLATCTITISFCSNLVMIQDKYSGSRKDLTISPVKRSTLALSYFIASFLATLLVCLITTGLGLIYIGIVGWYLTFVDILYTILDVILLTLFGTALSSIIHFFLTNQGQASAVGTIVSSLYGFICGAYMPMSQFPEGLQKVLSFLPGTYGTVLFRNHLMNSVVAEYDFPAEVITGIKDSMDINFYFFDNKVEIYTMYLIIAGTVLALIGIYVLMNVLKKKNSK